MSKAKTARQRKEARRRGLIYLKAWLPTLTVLLLLIAMLIPCLRYTVAGTGTKEPISEVTLLSNSFTTARGILFGEGDWEKNEIGYAKASFATVLVSIALFLVSAAMAIWASIGATRYYLNPERAGREHAIYRTFFNRPLLFVYQLLMLPLLAVPRLNVLYFQKLLGYPTILNLTFPEPIMIGIVLLILHLVLMNVTKKWERRMGLDAFAAPNFREEEESDEETEDYEAPHFASDAERETYEMNERARAEQLERIRTMLSSGKKEREESEENEEI